MANQVLRCALDDRDCVTTSLGIRILMARTRELVRLIPHEYIPVSQWPTQDLPENPDK